MGENTKIKNLLITEFGKKCMLGGNITLYNPLTVHHIVRRKEGGITTLENTSLITNQSHVATHIISEDDMKAKQKLINYLREYKAALEHVRLDMRVEMSNYISKRMEEMDYIPHFTKDNILIYKRRDRI